jgi:hypothetical protein
MLGALAAYKEAMTDIANAAEASGLLSDLVLAERPGGEDGDGAGSSSDHAADGPAFFQRQRELKAALLGLTPASSMNDRAPNGRAGARLVRGVGAGDDMPTCAEHAAVNIGEAGSKAIDALLRPDEHHGRGRGAGQDQGDAPSSATPGCGRRSSPSRPATTITSSTCFPPCGPSPSAGCIGIRACSAALPCCVWRSAHYNLTLRLFLLQVGRKQARR